MEQVYSMYGSDFQAIMAKMDPASNMVNDPVEIEIETRDEIAQSLDVEPQSTPGNVYAITFQEIMAEADTSSNMANGLNLEEVGIGIRIVSDGGAETLEGKAVPVATQTTQRKVVPEAEKDEKYWDKRIKNRAATKQFREIKKDTMKQMTNRIEFLDKACADLEGKIMKLKED